MNKLLKMGLCLVLSLALVIGFTSCKEGELEGVDGIALFKSAIEKYEDLNAIDMDFNIKADVDVAGEKISVNANMGIKVIEEDTNPIVSMNVSMEVSGVGAMLMPGMNQNMSVYFADGFAYYDEGISGQKYKQEVSVDDLLSQNLEGLDLSEFDLSKFASLDEKYLIVNSVKKDGSNKIVNFTIKSEIFTDLLFGGMFDSLLGGADIAISDIGAKVTIDKDGFLKAIVIALEIRGDEADATMGISMNINVSVELGIVINKVGSDVKIDVPGDLGEYKVSDSLYGDVGGLGDFEYPSDGFFGDDLF